MYAFIEVEYTFKSPTLFHLSYKKTDNSILGSLMAQQ